MALLALIALLTLAANGARQLRFASVAFLAVALTATAIASASSTRMQLAVEAVAALCAAGLLFVAARDGSYGEEPGWRLWGATIVAAAATPAAFASFRTATAEATQVPLFGADPGGVTVQVAAFWLISSGIAILLTARSAVRMSVGALLMITGVQLLVRLATGPQLAPTLLFSWLEVLIALVGAFLVINERVVREA
ncbi:MAG TPA: hypothetical protein VFM93_13310 [Candidatus Limnocylindria bacterium]|nr:hypothetical protein [Candidatus Limnocylindria bacterium]